jgi:chromate transporter
MPPGEGPSFGEATSVWAKIGLLSFGGPAGQIALMHRTLVEERRWIDEGQFLHALKFCTLLPGPEAQQLATYVGWLFHGVPGALVAGSLFVLPGVAVLLGLSLAYYRYGSVPAIGGVLLGLKAAVLAIVLDAVVRLARRALPDGRLGVLAVAAFLALAVFGVPFPLVVIGAGVIGVAIARPSSDPVAPSLTRPAPRLSRTVLIAIAGLALWLGPIGLLAVEFGPAHRFVQMGRFFSQAAVVTFGGAYAVLTYAAQRVVGEFGWLRPEEMVDGLALAETTPGPLILVLQFVGFLAGSRAGSPIAGAAGGIVGSMIAVWTTFVPSMLFVLLGAPYMERLREWKALTGALTAVTAAVLGVIANLALWFALHTLFASQREVLVLHHQVDLPILASIRLPALGLAIAAAVAVFRFRRGMIEVLAGAAGLGLAWQLLGGR